MGINFFIFVSVLSQKMSGKTVYSVVHKSPFVYFINIYIIKFTLTHFCFFTILKWAQSDKSSKWSENSSYNKH